jgi:hypothetical protein
MNNASKQKREWKKIHSEAVDKRRSTAFFVELE